MSIITTDLQPTLLTLSRKRFTRNDYQWLVEKGFFEPEERYELIDGELIEIMGQKEPHASLMMQWVFALAAVFGPDYIRCQAPVVLSDYSQPEPDVMVTSQPSSVYRDSGNTPHSTEVRLIVEVCLSSLAYDITLKASRYSQAGIPEYWALDVAGRRLLVHRDPTPNGYGSIVAYSANDSVSPLADPNASFRVGDFLP